MKKRFFFGLILFLIKRLVAIDLQSFECLERIGYSLGDEKPPVIWFHTDGIEDILTVDQFIKELEKRDIEAAYYITTSSIEAKLLADDIVDNYLVQALLNDSLDQAINCFKKIKPKAIVFIKEVTMFSSAMLLAHLLEIPTFLINGQFNKQVERLLAIDQYINVPLFNTLNHIYSPIAKDIDAYKRVGVDKPSFFLCGNTRTFNKLNQKREFLNQLGLTSRELKKRFPYPVLLVSPLGDQSIDQFLILYTHVKQRYPDLKLILTIEDIFSWNQSENNIVKRMNYRHFVLSDTTLIKQKNGIKKMQLILDHHDIIFTFSTKNTFLFFLQAIAAIHLIDGNFHNIDINHFIDSAAWENPIIIAPSNRKISSDIDKVTREIPFSVNHDLQKEIVIIHAQDEKDLTSKVLLLLDDDELRNAMGKHSLNGLRSMSLNVAKTLEPLFDSIKNCIKRVYK